MGSPPTSRHLNLLVMWSGLRTWQVVEATWKEGCRQSVIDPTVYTGLLGTAFTCLRSYEATGHQQDLLLCAEVVDACANVARPSQR
ncbi:LanC-like protein gcl1 [Asimina triloba]